MSAGVPTSYFLLPTSYFLLPTSYWSRAMRKLLVCVGIMAVMGFAGAAWTSGGQSPRSLTLSEMHELRAGYNHKRCLNVTECVNCVAGGSCFTASTQAACEAMVVTACAGGPAHKNCYPETNFNCFIPFTSIPTKCITLSGCQWMPSMPPMMMGSCGPKVGSLSSISHPACDTSPNQ